MSRSKANVLIVGTGGVGTLAAYALETGGRAWVTAVMRSNYRDVLENGISIDSVEHGNDIRGWRPTTTLVLLVRNTVPDVIKEHLPPFDFILVTVKNIADVPPSVSDLIRPAVTASKTAIVLSQNGINIEKPVIAQFPRNPVISSVSMISTAETSPGHFVHTDPDRQEIGPFDCGPGVGQGAAEAAAREYIAIYDPHTKLDVAYQPDVLTTRWRKLVYNASYNSTAAVLGMDTTRMRMSQHVVDDLVRPIMMELVAAARAHGVELPDDLPDRQIRTDPIESFFKPSMCQDADKGRLMEIETIVGEPLREGEAKGVAMPNLRVMYGILKALQLKTKEAMGLWEPKFADDNPYR